MAGQNDREAITSILRGINNGWLEGAIEDIPSALGPFFHEDVIFRGPDFGIVGRGRQSCVKSYQDFRSQASIIDCQLSEPEVDLCGPAAVAILPWRMTYIFNGQECTESGREMWVFSCDSSRDWLCILRVLIATG